MTYSLKFKPNALKEWSKLNSTIKYKDKIFQPFLLYLKVKTEKTEALDWVYQ